MVWPNSRQCEHPWDAFSPHRGSHKNCWNRVVCACGLIEYFCCSMSVNRNRFQWRGSYTACWLKANNPPLHQAVQSAKTPGNPQVNKTLCVPAPPCPRTAVPPPFPCSSLGAGNCLLLISQIQRETKGSFAGGVLWILTRFWGIWCISVLKNLNIWFMLCEPLSSSLDRKQLLLKQWSQSMGSSTPHLHKLHSKLRGELFHLESSEQLLLFWFCFNIVRKPQRTQHTILLCRKEKSAPLQEEYTHIHKWNFLCTCKSMHAPSDS